MWYFKRVPDAIILHQLTKLYGPKKVVDQIDLTIKSGELFALLGPNGAGKTTTIKMLATLLRPSSGSATVLGFDVAARSSELRRQINLSPQETAIAPNLTVRENLMLVGQIYNSDRAAVRQRVDELIDEFKLADWQNQKARQLSGGWQRRLSIALGLVTNPAILFLDEPTLGLDPQARRELWDKITALKGRVTIILTTHYLEEAEFLADRVGVIKDGRLAALGTVEQLKSQLGHGLTVTVSGRGVNAKCIPKITSKYPTAKLAKDQLVITGDKIVFDDLVTDLRAAGIKIERLNMQESTLDDVFLNLLHEDA